MTDCCNDSNWRSGQIVRLSGETWIAGRTRMPARRRGTSFNGLIDKPLTTAGPSVTSSTVGGLNLNTVCGAVRNILPSKRIFRNHASASRLSCRMAPPCSMPSILELEKLTQWKPP